MLDTGIDIHEIVNLVFFKTVRSKAKFWQMIGRGTRTCLDLFGPGLHKENFRIFDFCDNFAFFDAYPEGITPGRIESLTQKIFRARVLLAHQLSPVLPGEDPGNRRLFTFLADTLQRHVEELDPRSFFVRPHRQYVEKYSQRPRWDQLEIGDVTDIQAELAPLMSPTDPDEFARWFDLLILNLQLSLLEKKVVPAAGMNRLQDLAKGLEKLGTIPAVKARMARIREVRGESFPVSPHLVAIGRSAP